MTSIMGNIFRLVIRHKFNANPEICNDQIASVKQLEAGMSYKTNKGFKISREKTQNGTRYEHVEKIGATKNGRVVLLLHGGAYIAGLTGLYRQMAKDFWKSLGCEVYLLDYDCAPEFKYPTQVNQALDLWDELTEKLGYLPKNIVVGGDSAGGNLTLALLLKLRDSGKEMPLAAFCMSPWADMTASGESYFSNYNVDVMFGNKKTQINDERRQKLINCDIYSFIGDQERTNYYISPVFADYHGFPPMFFTVGSHEMLMSDTLTIVQKLKDNSIEVGLEIGDKMFHSYTIFRQYIPEARRAFKKIKEFLSKCYEK